MKPAAIYVLDRGFFDVVFGPSERRRLDACLDFIAAPMTASELATTKAPVESVEVIVSSWTPPVMDEPMLERFPQLRAIFHAAGTVRPFVTEAIWRRGVRVVSAAKANAIPVAEFTLSQILFCLKHGWQRVFEVRSGTHFRREDVGVPGTYAATVGLISLGHTGWLVADRLRGFDVSVVAYDPFVSPDRAHQLGIRLCPLEEVFATSDIVSCHTPLLPETKDMLRGHHFARMRPGACFINTARGAVVHEEEMIAVLKSRPDLFAVLDVTSPEPPALTSPLHTLTNVVLTPHIAGSLGREYQRLGRMIAEEVERYLAGQPLEGEIISEQMRLIA